MSDLPATVQYHANPTVRLHFRKYGDSAKPPVVILHGLFGSSVNWRSFAQSLSEQYGYAVFCLDLRNHGQSPWHEQMEYSALAADVQRFITTHHLQGAALLGHSMGGKTAMVLAQQGHLELAKLIVVDIAPRTYSSACHAQLITSMRSLDLATLSNRSQIDAVLATRIADRATRQFLMQNLTKHAHRYRWKINLPAIQHNLPALAGYANSPVCQLNTLFIAGANSDYIPHTSHAQILDRFPNARIETLAHAGHWLHVEQPSRLLALCDAFLAA